MAGVAAVEPLGESYRERAEKLQKIWGLNTDSKVKAVVSAAGVGLQFVDKALGKKPYYVDFVDLNWKQRFAKGLPRHHIFRKALGLHDGRGHLLDATAGFGQDAVMALTLGVSVTAVERSAVVGELLKDGLARAIGEDETLKSRLAKLKVITADSVDYLAKLKAADAPDVIYLDPMFDKPKKSAKSPKEMQLLQALLGPPPSAEEELKLFEKALAVAKKRVVVKRALKAKALRANPSSSFKGQSVRYDVYLK
jgi:16S rRNA (guanine1516-N2)-methyltransferase